MNLNAQTFLERFGAIWVFFKLAPLCSRYLPLMTPNQTHPVEHPGQCAVSHVSRTHFTTGSSPIPRLNPKTRLDQTAAVSSTAE